MIFAEIKVKHKQERPVDSVAWLSEAETSGTA